MCLYPRLMKNPKYKSNKKNGGIIPECKDERTKLVPVGCGNCMECKKQRANWWKIRLNEEVRNWKKAEKWFITLTFSNESLETLGREVEEEFKDIQLRGYDMEHEIARLAIRYWTERWRKKKKKALRHWIVTELGQESTERLHLHALIFTEDIQTAIDKWQYGRVVIGDGHKHYVNEQTIGYIVKYMTKTDEKHPDYKGKIYASKGIGASYLQREKYYNEYRGKDTRLQYKTREGRTMGLPTYYKTKIYTEDQKEDLWIQTLDKDERYVNGVKIRQFSKNQKHYEGVLEVARDKNKRLGFGELENWDLYEYRKKLTDVRKMRKSKKTKEIKK